MKDKNNSNDRCSNLEGLDVKTRTLRPPYNRYRKKNLNQKKLTAPGMNEFDFNHFPKTENQKMIM